jgi:hypothetical protein
MKRRTAIIVTLATLVVVSAVAIGLYEYSVQQRNEKCSESATSLVGMFGMVTLQTGSNGSSLTLTVTDTTCTPITGVTVLSVDPQIAGVANTPFVEFNGMIISPASPLPAGQLGTGSLSVKGVQAGQKYVLTVQVDFASGTTAQTETFEMYPEG